MRTFIVINETDEDVTLDNRILRPQAPTAMLGRIMDEPLRDMTLMLQEEGEISVIDREEWDEKAWRAQQEDVYEDYSVDEGEEG